MTPAACGLTAERPQLSSSKLRKTESKLTPTRVDVKVSSIIIVPKDKTKISDIFMLWETMQARRGRRDKQ